MESSTLQMSFLTSSRYPTVIHPNLFLTHLALCEALFGQGDETFQQLVCLFLARNEPVDIGLSHRGIAGTLSRRGSRCVVGIFVSARNGGGVIVGCSSFASMLIPFLLGKPDIDRLSGGQL